MCWSAAAFHWGWGDDPIEVGPPGRGGRGGPPPPWFLDRPEVADWVLLPVLVFVAGLALRRVWPRPAFVAIVVGVGGYLAAGAMFPPVFVAPALGIYAMATALPLRRWLPLTALLVPMIAAGYWSRALPRSTRSGAVRGAGVRRRAGHRAGPVRPAPPQPAGERAGDPGAGPAAVRVRGADADRPGRARRGRPQPLGDHHAGRGGAARAGPATGPGGGVAGGDPDHQPGGAGRAADDAGGVPRPGERRAAGAAARAGPAGRPGRGAAPGGPAGRGGARGGRVHRCRRRSTRPPSGSSRRR